MGVWEHIRELRKRLMASVIALAVTAIASFLFAQYLIEYLSGLIGGLENLTAIEVTENVSVFMRVSFSGFILSFPIIFYQVMAFVYLACCLRKTQSFSFYSFCHFIISRRRGICFLCDDACGHSFSGHIYWRSSDKTAH